MTEQVNIFEKASRRRLRFSTPRNTDMTVEDLWALQLESGNNSLNLVAQIINRQLKETGEESFVGKKTEKDSDLQLALDVVKHVIAVKLAEKEERDNQIARRERREYLTDILARKQNQELEGKSAEEIQQMLDAL